MADASSLLALLLSGLRGAAHEQWMPQQSPSSSNTSPARAQVLHLCAAATTGAAPALAQCVPQQRPSSSNTALLLQPAGVFD
jgi:hypothetical protein